MRKTANKAAAPKRTISHLGAFVASVGCPAFWLVNIDPTDPPKGVPAGALTYTRRFD